LANASLVNDVLIDSKMAAMSIVRQPYFRSQAVDLLFWISRDFLTGLGTSDFKWETIDSACDTWRA
jgi:hypothetical protein